MEAILSHMALVAKCCQRLTRAYDIYLKGDVEAFNTEAREMKGIETEADELRRQVELAIYSGAFMPIHREDYLDLAEIIDKVADKAMAVVNLLMLTRIKIPEAVQERMREMLEITIRCVDTLHQCVSVCIEDRGKTAEMARKVERLEETIDAKEFDLRRSLYAMNVDGYDKILLNELVEKMGDISDTAEDVSDRIMAMASKRR